MSKAYRAMDTGMAVKQQDDQRRERNGMKLPNLRRTRLYYRWRLLWDGPIWQIQDEDRRWSGVKEFPPIEPDGMPDPHILNTEQGRKAFLDGLNTGLYGHPEDRERNG